MYIYRYKLYREYGVDRVFPTSFAWPWFQKILFDVICLEILYNDIAFFLTVIDEDWMK